MKTILLSFSLMLFAIIGLNGQTEIAVQGSNETQFSFAQFINVGNKFYRNGDIPEAILNYEKALLINPSNDLARKNLRLANDKQELFDENMESNLHIWKKTIVSVFMPKTWFVLGLLSSFSFCYFLFKLLINAEINNKTKIGGITTLILSLCFLIFSYLRTQDLTKNPYFIAKTQLQLYSSPDERSDIETPVIAGSKLQKIDQIGDWFKVKIGFTNEGWVKSDEITQIKI